MRILLQSASLLPSSDGSHTQIIKTKEYLEKFGVRVDFSFDLKPDLSRYDIVHLFNIQKPYETFKQCLNARRQHKKVVLSPIYHNVTEWNQKGRIGREKIFHSLVRDRNLNELIKTVSRFLKGKSSFFEIITEIKTNYLSQQRLILELSDIWLVNSQMEYERIVEDFGLEHSYQVAYCGVSPIFSEGDRNKFISKFKIKDFILCVSRFESRKNQLSAIRALKDTDLALVFVGPVNPFHKAYYRKCKSEATKNMIFLDEISSFKELASVYAAAKVHILASWFETCGLVNLEAAIAGCNIVVSDRGYTKEYLKDYTWYCDPSSIRSIRQAISDAYYSKRTPDLKIYIVNNYTWDKTAKETLNAYQRILSK